MEHTENEKDGSTEPSFFMFFFFAEAAEKIQTGYLRIRSPKHRPRKGADGYRAGQID